MNYVSDSNLFIYLFIYLVIYLKSNLSQSNHLSKSNLLSKIKYDTFLGKARVILTWFSVLGKPGWCNTTYIRDVCSVGG